MFRKRTDDPGAGQSDRRVESTTPESRPTQPARLPSGPGIPERRTVEAQAAAEDAAKKLIVGRDIALSGEIQRCEMLVVEGRVDARLADGRSIEIAETGLFKGTVAVDSADIGGRLEGDLTVRQRLTIRATGRVEGAVRYGELAIEAGGILVGPIEVLPPPAAATAEETAAEPGDRSSPTA